ncbi:MAG TPA: thiolase family protein [Mycobacteriales bacterium]|jgi:acetyl-CoA acetyltransferase family protein|nr:thiolase family protein [Mycobacteriales bacterium]
MADAYFIDGVRTVFGKAGGALAGVRADDLAASAIAELLARNPQLPPDKVDDVVWGATNQAGDDSRNVGRTAALLAGMPEGTAGYTVNRLCGSGLEAAATASRAIRSGDVDLCIAGGSESMSRAPFILPRPDRAYPRTQELYDSRLGWRGVNPRWAQRYGALTLGECAELTAERYGVSRARQDEYAARSHELAARAWDGGSFDADTIPGRDPDGLALLTRDESIRPAADPESLARLRPAFRPGGTVTAGNSSPMNDGAAAILLAGPQAVRRLGLTPLGRIAGAVSVGVHPDALDGPVTATRRLLAKIGWDHASVGTIELTEAFAAQAVACIEELEWKPNRVNAWGGAIAIGHPLGASGARLLMTLVSRMRCEGSRRGIATMCIGVGQGIAVAVELAE